MYLRSECLPQVVTGRANRLEKSPTRSPLSINGFKLAMAAAAGMLKSLTDLFLFRRSVSAQLTGDRKLKQRLVRKETGESLGQLPARSAGRGAFRWLSFNRGRLMISVEESFLKGDSLSTDEQRLSSFKT